MLCLVKMWQQVQNVIPEQFHMHTQHCVLSTNVIAFDRLLSSTESYKNGKDSKMTRNGKDSTMLKTLNYMLRDSTTTKCTERDYSFKSFETINKPQL